MDAVEPQLLRTVHPGENRLEIAISFLTRRLQVPFNGNLFLKGGQNDCGRYSWTYKCLPQAAIFFFTHSFISPTASPPHPTAVENRVPNYWTLGKNKYEEQRIVPTMAPCAMADEVPMPMPVQFHSTKPATITASVLHGPRDLRIVRSQLFPIYL